MAYYAEIVNGEIHRLIDVVGSVEEPKPEEEKGWIAELDTAEYTILRAVIGDMKMLHATVRRIERMLND